jgi:Uncharacterised nucleotidyltransferase
MMRDDMTQHTNPTDRIDTLLALCARANGHPAQHERLAQLAGQLSSWEAIAERAETHGLVPLLYTHLHAAGVALPSSVKQQLLGYYMQHAHATRVRALVLADILARCRAEGIDVLVLKGAALAYLVYPQPALRPMRDIDILVRAEDVYRAYALLPEIGFTPPPGAHDGLDPNHHHLTAIKRVADGFSVSVEVHHALHLNEPGHPKRFDAFAPTAQTVMLGGHSAQTLGREETLWHIYRHAFCMPVGYEPTRLIWVADLISLVEAWIDTLDWERVRREYGAAYRILPLLHSLTPWSDTTLERLKLPVARLPSGAGASYQGWPRFPLAAHRIKGFGRILRDSFFPSPWWLRLHYGQGPALGGYWRAWLVHQRAIWPQIGHVVVRDARQYARRLVRAHDLKR